MRKMLMVVAVLVMGLCVAAGSTAWGQEKPTTGGGQDKANAAAADPITGEWDGSVEMLDGGLAFSLKLKLENGKVTGEVTGQQGTAAVTEGTFAEGKLAIAFSYVDGSPVAMTGTLADGQITGSLTYGGGQVVANWAAKKRPAKQ